MRNFLSYRAFHATADKRRTDKKDQLRRNNSGLVPGQKSLQFSFSDCSAACEFAVKEDERRAKAVAYTCLS